MRGVPSICTMPQNSSLKVLSGKGPPPGAMPPRSCVLGLPLSSFHHSSASSKMKPPRHVPPLWTLLSSISEKRALVALAWSSSSSSPVLALKASAPNSARNIGLVERASQSAKRGPKVRPLYTFMPHTSMSDCASISSEPGTIPYTVATRCRGSTFFTRRATSWTRLEASSGVMSEYSMLKFHSFPITHIRIAGWSFKDFTSGTTLSGSASPSM
mmetsp:Transcript_51798/g.137582  ORF Transcript_51798/g.137582 Transcript_51798/m.137582 type:complete len:214 (-) Transcript_51798:152-793(-)